MTRPESPSLKSLPSTPDRPSTAQPARTPTCSGAPKVVAEGVRSALCPDPQPVMVSVIRPGLEIRGLDRGEVLVADWLCACGHHERARGRAAVIELTGRVRVGHCPHRATETDRRKAA